jgi:hypothetical protein
VSLGLAAGGHRPTAPRPPASGQTPLVSISYPLSRDRFLVLPGRESLRLTLKADCRLPLAAVTWFVNGREEGVTGPPYELALELPRGRHRLMALGPDGLGDAVEVVVE